MKEWQLDLELRFLLQCTEGIHQNLEESIVQVCFQLVIASL